MRDKTYLPVAFLVPLFLILMIALPSGLSLAPVVFVSGAFLKILALSAAPLIFIPLFVTISAILSLPFQKAIIPGKFPRKITHIIYGPRRLYALCWCSVFYSTPIYYGLMGIGGLKKVFMWSFGYRGSPNVEIAPDAWLRDLPLLKFEEGAYAANKCTIGTNICLTGGHVLVDRIGLGKNTMIGHLTMVAPGCHFRDQIEIGVGSGIGIRVKIGDKSRIGPTTTVNHGAVIGSNVDIGTMAYVGLKARIGDGITIPSGAVIAEGSEILSQEDVINTVNREKEKLIEKKTELGSLFESRTSMPKNG